MICSTVKVYFCQSTAIIKLHQLMCLNGALVNVGQTYSVKFKSFLSRIPFLVLHSEALKDIYQLPCNWETVVTFLQKAAFSISLHKFVH